MATLILRGTKGGTLLQCPECRADNPEFAHFCNRCGHGLRRADRSKHGRNNTYAVAPTESVMQFALVSTVMPHSSRDTADNYRWALIVMSVVTLGLALAGLLPAAVVAAAFLVPLTYLLYLYDVNMWEDTPLTVLGGVMVVAGVLSTVVSIVFFRWLFDDELLSLVQATTVRGQGLEGISLFSLFLFVIAVPVIGEICKQGPALLIAAKDRFSDQIDALTLGVAAGTTYAAFESVIQYAPVFASSQNQTSDGIVPWLVVLINVMLVKSLIYGTATGIALAAFSGRGESVDGYTGSYWGHALLAVGANVVYWLGVRLLSFAPFGTALGLVWGIVILGGLILKMRMMMQSALLEAAVEDAAAGRASAAASVDESYCPNCEMQLLPGAMFCIVCGMSVKAASHQARTRIKERNAVGGAV